MKYLYHIVPKQVVGSRIVPLNVLRDTRPDLHARYIKKYDGREDVTRQDIPPLNCKWNDVVFLTAVHPHTLLEAYDTVGAPLFKRRFYQINPETLDHSKMVVRLYENKEEASEGFVPFSVSMIDRYSRVPKRTIEYYRAQMSAGKPFFIFAYVPHILLKGTVDVSRARIIQI